MITSVRRAIQAVTLLHGWCNGVFCPALSQSSGLRNAASPSDYFQSNCHPTPIPSIHLPRSRRVYIDWSAIILIVSRDGARCARGCCSCSDKASATWEDVMWCDVTPWQSVNCRRPGRSNMLLDSSSLMLHWAHQRRSAPGTSSTSQTLKTTTTTTTTTTVVIVLITLCHIYFSSMVAHYINKSTRSAHPDSGWIPKFIGNFFVQRHVYDKSVQIRTSDQNFRSGANSFWRRPVLSESSALILNYSSSLRRGRLWCRSLCMTGIWESQTSGFGQCKSSAISEV